MEIFEKDCLVRICTCIAPRGVLEEGDKQQEILSVKGKMPDGNVIDESIAFGTIKRIALGEHLHAEVELIPAKGFDVGAGPGRALNTRVDGGVEGIIIDARGRPLSLPGSVEERRKKLLEWFAALDAYPNQVYKMERGG
jgi:hypothetical protein